MARRTTLRASRQSDLDRFCGLVALVNVVRFCTRDQVLTHAQCRLLFSELGRVLLKRGDLHYVLRNGTGDDQLVGLADFITGYVRRHHRFRLESYRPFHRKRTKPGLREFVRLLREYLREPGRAILIRFQIYQQEVHYSVARSVTATSILLFDSDGMTRLPIRSCATGLRLPNRTRRHVIRAESSIYFEVLD